MTDTIQSYILIGAGGTGSHFIAPALAYLDSYHRNNGSEWQFVIVDGDNYDAGNLERQLFEPGMVSMNKAKAMATMYNRYQPIAIDKFIGKEDLEQIFQDGDILFIAADNHSIRALVQERALQLGNCVVVNAGNELHDGNVQLWVRENGENLTPKLTYMHPEIVYSTTTDRAPMSCQQAALLPGGGQLILANAQAANWMLAALWRYHTGEFRHKCEKMPCPIGWTEVQFDLALGTVHHIDMRERRGWTL